jgi:hypothetical protein
MVHLAGLVVARGLRPPNTYGPEFVAQFRFAMQLAIIPLSQAGFDGQLSAWRAERVSRKDVPIWPEDGSTRRS